MHGISELSRFIRVEEIPHSGLSQNIVADVAEREALAERFNLKLLETLEASVKIQFLAGGPMVRVSGQGHAGLIQSCVITGDAVPNALNFSIEADYVPPAQAEHDLELSLSDADPPEPFEDGGIDLGELVAQTLALSLDPYPRLPDSSLGKVMGGVAFADRIEANAPDRASPFAALAKLGSQANED